MILPDFLSFLQRLDLARKTFQGGVAVHMNRAKGLFI